MGGGVAHWLEVPWFIGWSWRGSLSGGGVAHWLKIVWLIIWRWHSSLVEGAWLIGGRWRGSLVGDGIAYWLRCRGSLVRDDVAIFNQAPPVSRGSIVINFLGTKRHLLLRQLATCIKCQGIRPKPSTLLYGLFLLMA